MSKISSGSGIINPSPKNQPPQSDLAISQTFSTFEGLHHFEQFGLLAVQLCATPFCKGCPFARDSAFCPFARVATLLQGIVLFALLLQGLELVFFCKGWWLAALLQGVVPLLGALLQGVVLSALLQGLEAATSCHPFARVMMNCSTACAKVSCLLCGGIQSCASWRVVMGGDTKFLHTPPIALPHICLLLPPSRGWCPLKPAPGSEGTRPSSLA